MMAEWMSSMLIFELEVDLNYCVVALSLLQLTTRDWPFKNDSFGQIINTCICTSLIPHTECHALKK